MSDRLEQIRQRWLDVISSDDIDEPYEILQDVAWLIMEVEQLRETLAFEAFQEGGLEHIREGIEQRGKRVRGAAPHQTREET